MNARHEQFAREYTVDLNATRAYRAVYPKATIKTAEANGAKLLRKAEVAEFISKLLAERAARTEITADLVVKGLLEEARLRGKGSTHSARVQAWGLLGRHLGLFTDKIEHSGKVQTSTQATPDLAKLTDEQLHQIDTILLAAESGPSSS